MYRNGRASTLIRGNTAPTPPPPELTITDAPDYVLRWLAVAHFFLEHTLPPIRLERGVVKRKRTECERLLSERSEQISATNA